MNQMAARCAGNRVLAVPGIEITQSPAKQDSQGKPWFFGESAYLAGFQPGCEAPRRRPGSPPDMAL